MVGCLPHINAMNPQRHNATPTLTAATTAWIRMLDSAMEALELASRSPKSPRLLKWSDDWSLGKHSARNSWITRKKKNNFHHIHAYAHSPPRTNATTQKLKIIYSYDPSRITEWECHAQANLHDPRDALVGAVFFRPANASWPLCARALPAE